MPASGVGGRCPLHGGTPAGGPFVLLPGLGWRERDSSGAFTDDGRPEPRAWSAYLVPDKLWRKITQNGALDFEQAWPRKIDGIWFGDINALDPDPGNARRMQRTWPALIGLRVARRLVERGRVTHAVIDSARTARKLRTLRPPAWSDEQWSAWVDGRAVIL